MYHTFIHWTASTSHALTASTVWFKCQKVCVSANRRIFCICSVSCWIYLNHTEAQCNKVASAMEQQQMNDSIQQKHDPYSAMHCTVSTVNLQVSHKMPAHNIEINIFFFNFILTLISANSERWKERERDSRQAPQFQCNVNKLSHVCTRCRLELVQQTAINAKICCVFYVW